MPQSPDFAAQIVRLDASFADRLSQSWRPGCPVELTDLALITMPHWNYDGDIQEGELVVSAAHAEDVAAAFGRLYDARFPIQRMEIVDVYGGDDNASMAANNTSAFNCREVAWRPGVWSNHALGQAIDINPLVNPYVKGDTILPPEGAAFADRSVEATGGIYPDDIVVRAFVDIGWGWGGDWSSAKDWQHFSASGN